MAQIKMAVKKTDSNAHGIKRIFSASPKEHLPDYAMVVVVEGVGYVIPIHLHVAVESAASIGSTVYSFNYERNSVEGKFTARFSTLMYRGLTCTNLTAAYCAAMKHVLEKDGVEQFSIFYHPRANNYKGCIQVTNSQSKSGCSIGFNYYKLDLKGLTFPKCVITRIYSARKEVNPVEFEANYALAVKMCAESIRNLGEWGVYEGTHVRKNDPRIQFI